MKTPIRFLIAIILLSGLGLQSCKKSDNPVDPGKSMDDLIIPNGFVFETTREVAISIQMPESVEFTEMRSRFDIYSASPDAGGKLITSGSFDQNGSFEGDIVVPSTLTELYVQTFAGSVIVSLVPANGTKDGGVIIDFGDDYGNYPPDSLPATLKSQKNTNTVFKTVKNQAVVTNLVANGDFSNDNFGYYSAANNS